MPETDHDRYHLCRRRDLPGIVNCGIQQEACGLTGTADLPRPAHTLATLVQIYTACCALGRISHTCGASGRPIPIPCLPISTVPVPYVYFLFQPSEGPGPISFGGCLNWFCRTSQGGRSQGVVVMMVGVEEEE